MSYDESLAVRIRYVLKNRENVTEKKMFGGLAFLLHGKMFCGIVKDELMVRVGPDRFEDSLGEAHVRPMDFTGRPMNGYVFVEPEGCLTEKEVKVWVERGTAFATTLVDSPRPKQKKPRTKKVRPRSRRK
jgi:TfoX/Sxy family transcriptional regulator of competence genes